MFYYEGSGQKSSPIDTEKPKEEPTDTTTPDTVIPLPELPGWLSWLQSGLDVAGCAPVIGNTADLINTLIYIAVGDYGNASLAAISMIPLVGDAIGKGAKTVKFAVKHSDELVDAIKLVSKKVDKVDEITDGVKATGNGKAIVIGEGMGRIKKATKELQAQGIDAKWYQAWSKYYDDNVFDLDKSLARNRRWIQSKIDEGYKIFDIGPDGRIDPSKFYKLEQDIINDYPTTKLLGY